jgi:hypothetical protein
MHRLAETGIKQKTVTANDLTSRATNPNSSAQEVRLMRVRGCCPIRSGRFPTGAIDTGAAVARTPSQHRGGKYVFCLRDWHAAIATERWFDHLTGGACVFGAFANRP